MTGKNSHSRLTVRGLSVTEPRRLCGPCQSLCSRSLCRITLSRLHHPTGPTSLYEPLDFRSTVVCGPLHDRLPGTGQDPLQCLLYL